MYEIGSNNWPGMAKVMEEAGELMKVMAKLMSGRGAHIYWDGTNLVPNLVEELADLEAALWFFMLINRERLMEGTDGTFQAVYDMRLRYKQDKFFEWHHKNFQRTIDEASSGYESNG